MTWVALTLAVVAFGYALCLGTIESKDRKGGGSPNGHDYAARSRERFALFVLAVVLMLIAGAAAAIDEKVT